MKKQNIAKAIFVLAIMLVNVTVGACTHPHNFEYTVIQEATSTTDGLMRANCNCGRSENIILPAGSTHYYANGFCVMCKRAVSLEKYGATLTVDASKFYASSNRDDNYLNVNVLDDGERFGADVNLCNTIYFAPGESGSMVITFEGTPEVSLELNVDLNGLTDGFSEMHLCDYYPIVWSVSGTDISTPITGKLKYVLSALRSVIGANRANEEVKNSYTLTWNWPISNSVECEAYDTAIGYKLSGSSYDSIIGERIKEFVSEQDYNQMVVKTKFDLSVYVSQIN